MTRRLRIAIDARPLQTGSRYQGIGTYTYHLIRGIVELEPDHDVLVLAFGDAPLEIDCRRGRYERVTLRRPLKHYKGGKKQALTELQDSFLMPLDLLRARADVYHNPLVLGTAWRYPCKSVVTVHDLITLIFPELYLGGGRWMRRVHAHAARASHLITVSESSKRDIVERMGVAAERIAVTYEAADELFVSEHSDDAKRRVRARFGLREDRRFLLYTAGMTAADPRKNVREFLGVFARLVAGGFDDVDLVIAGKKGPATPPIVAEAERLGLGERVRFTDFVPTEDLPVLYHLAAAFIFPSRYEGFGLPVVEAMASGTPVVSSDRTSLPEVAGDAAVLVDPDDLDGWFEATRRILTDPVHAAELRRKGLARAAGFSWERLARETLAVYERVAGE